MLSNSKIQHAITGTSTSVANQVVNYQPSIGNFMMLKTQISKDL